MQWVTEGKKVYIHCDRGCDRTGVFCAILEGILGASADEIKSDLILSDTKGKGYRMSHPEATANTYIQRYGKGHGTLQENFINNVASMYSVDKNLMYNFIKAANQNPGALSARFGGRLVRLVRYSF